jgi:Do/DeqQ family serine protease
MDGMEFAMKKILLLGTAAVALVAAPLLTNTPAEAQLRFGQTEALTVDPQRGVLTMAPLLERVTPAVVSLDVRGTTKARGNSPEAEMLERFFGDRLPNRGNQERRGSGSGVIVDASEGLIITNNHVVEGADEIIVTLEDRRELEAELVGTDPQTDIALLRIDAKDLSELKFAATREAQVGDYVIAVGNPFGLSSTVTSGIISALGRDQGRGNTYSDYIQTDASINPGNSGGALVNSKGELIGINTAIVSRSGGNNGIGFAVPVRIVENVMAQLKDTGEVRRGRIGVAIQDVTPDLKAALGLKSLNGALVSEVGEDTPAEEAGLKSGDLVIAFNGEDVLDSSDLRNAVGLLQPGTKSDITFLRDGRRRTTRINVAEMPEDADAMASVDIEPEEMAMMEAFDGAEISDIPADMELRGGDEGVIVSSVERGSKAYRSGLRRGDVIRRVNNDPVDDLKDFEDAIDGRTGPFALSIERQGRTAYVAVK